MPHEMLQLPTLPVPLPSFSIVEWVMVIVAFTIPLAAYEIYQLSRVVTWMDVMAAMMFMVVPAVVILGLSGALGPAAVTAILGLAVVTAIGVIDSD